ncbi:unnamed protein product [Mytilus coruscus]|uniref:Fibrinogen C-terminal domain-containing protein n=1 Tax=Mytilus coruscus TaxID=42192 RepID=A0A6J8ESY0_MYTCO|nr:unnamed protein product [Mytilus coruscus]
MQNLLNLPTPTPGIKGLKSFSDTIESYIRELEGIGRYQKSYGSLLIPLILNKVPCFVRQNITRDHRNDDWDISSLRKAIQKEICIQEADPIETDIIPTASIVTETTHKRWRPTGSEGNEYIHALTTNGLHRIHIILEELNGTLRYADYSIFHVGDESTKYLLNVTGYSGNAGDCLDSDDISGRANGMKFTTKDQDYDRWSLNCAATYKGGWWYSKCDYCDLNGKYGIHGPSWYLDLHGLVKSSTMMITKV